jgi:hypothetical protein
LLFEEKKEDSATMALDEDWLDELVNKPIITPKLVSSSPVKVNEEEIIQSLEAERQLQKELVALVKEQTSSINQSLAEEKKLLVPQQVQCWKKLPVLVPNQVVHVQSQ